MSIHSSFKQILKGGLSVTLIGNGSFAVIGFANIAILIRAVPEELFGSWVLLLSVIGFFEMLRGGLLNTSLMTYASSADPEDQKVVIGSSWCIGIAVTLIICPLVYIGVILFPGSVNKPDFVEVLYWYPLIAFGGLPYSYATWVLISRKQFSQYVVLRVVLLLCYSALYIVPFLYPISLKQLFFGYCLINVTISSIAILLGWSGIQYIFSGTKTWIVKHVQFGKFSMGTLIGTNLLKNLDLWMIGYFFGTTAAGVYSIPLKLTEIFELSLRSMVTVAIPDISRKFEQGKLSEIKRLFETYAGALTWLHVPLVVTCFCLADYIIFWFTGKFSPEASAIFRCIMAYALFLPLDRFTGITLDCMRLPNLNLQKVILMVTVNGLGNLLAIKITNETWSVALITSLMTITGVIFGFYHLHSRIEINPVTTLKVGWKGLRNWRQLLNPKT